MHHGIYEIPPFSLGETHQSVFMSLHSTETARLRVHEDILGAINNNRSVALLLLDLSATFDRIDHGILLHRLEFCFGIKGSAPRQTREKPLAPRVHQTTHCLQNREFGNCIYKRH